MSDAVTEKSLVEVEAEKAVALARDLAEGTNAMMQNPQFRAFLEDQKAKEAQLNDLWKRIEELMIEHDVKQIKSDEWGTLTIAERINFVTNLELLPRGYKKMVADTTKIGNHYKLTGKLPAGAEPKPTKYLTKRLKLNQEGQING